MEVKILTENQTEKIIKEKIKRRISHLTKVIEDDRKRILKLEEELQISENDIRRRILKLEEGFVAMMQILRR